MIDLQNRGPSALGCVNLSLTIILLPRGITDWYNYWYNYCFNRNMICAGVR